MTDDRGDNKTGGRVEPGIRMDDQDRDKDFNSSEAFYNGDLFERREQESESGSDFENDFELNRFSDEEAAEAAQEHEEEADDGPIIPERDDMRTPPNAHVTPPTAASKAKQGSGDVNLPITTILAAAALLASLYAIWSGGSQAERIALLESNERPKIEDMDKLQNQDINALANRLSSVEKEQQRLTAMKAELESAISRQSNKIQSGLAGLESRMNKQDAALKSELETLARKQNARPVSTPPQPTRKTPAAAKPKPVVKKPAADDSELPGPIESASGAVNTDNSPATGRQSSWGVNLMSVESEAAANQEIKRLQGKGIQAEAIAITVGGKKMHRVRVAGFASKEEAVEMQSRLARDHGIKGTWVNNQ